MHAATPLGASGCPVMPLHETDSNASEPEVFSGFGDDVAAETHPTAAKAVRAGVGGGNQGHGGAGGAKERDTSTDAGAEVRCL